MGGASVYILITLFINVNLFLITHSADFTYGYECRKSKCLKVEVSAEKTQKAISLPVCRLFCGSTMLGTVWPKPTGLVKADSYMQQINMDAIDFKFPDLRKQAHIWEANKQRFMSLLLAEIPSVETLKNDGHQLKVTVKINDNIDETPKLTLDTDEGYTLKIAPVGDDTTAVEINAPNFFGARHGLETLSQLIVYDDIRDELQIVANAEIEDAPAFKWRGLLLDTSRNFYSVKSIKRTLDAMAMVKLNTFHWHITDSQSFPLELKSHPEMTKLGAYSSRKVYTRDQVADIVEYGRMRGIRVMPEFDAPAHVGEGWQHKNMTACFGYQPWRDYCGEPPCGQLDPTVDDLYPLLQDIYSELFEIFQPDVFHMGGDEVLSSCWNSSEDIQNWMKARNWALEEKNFMKLWGYFQEKALERVDRVADVQKPPIILWTSHLTEAPYIDDYLNIGRYIIQIWTTGFDPRIEEILKRGFRVIISNHNALYFDCGGPGWVNEGSNWCSPYKGWQTVYDNSLDEIAGKYKQLVLGAEAALWSEQIGEFTLDSRFWPRASALAERLWSNPTEDWRAAEGRMLYHRERLATHGIEAETLQPEWCLQQEGECSVK